MYKRPLDTTGAGILFVIGGQGGTGGPSHAPAPKDEVRHIADELEDIAGEIRDNYCKYAALCSTESELEAFCDGCPLRRLL